MFNEFVDYVAENYSRAHKIVEVGVGHRIDVAERIRKALPLTEVLATDNDEDSLRDHKRGEVRAVADDVIFPQTRVYKNALLIYSINPPVEIIPAMSKLATRVGADLLVVPRSDEQEALDQNEWQKIVRNGRTLGWLRLFKRENLPAENSG